MTATYPQPGFATPELIADARRTVRMARLSDAELAEALEQYRRKKDNFNGQVNARRAFLEDIAAKQRRHNRRYPVGTCFVPQAADQSRYVSEIETLLREFAKQQAFAHAVAERMTARRLEVPADLLADFPGV